MTANRLRQRTTWDDSTSIEVLFSRRVISPSRAWRPPTDVYETDEALVIQLEVAGVRPEDIVITINDRRLTVGGVRNFPRERRAYHQLEVPFGEFRTDVELPFPVDERNLLMEYVSGFLRLTLPKLRD